MKPDFNNRNVYVSGGSSGIGLAVAKHFASLGANVFIFSLDDMRILNDAMNAIKARRVSDTQRIASMQLDVTDNNFVHQRLGFVVKRFGKPYVLVNSAGIGGAFYFEDISYEKFDQTVKINLYGTRNTIAALLPFMKKGGGYIVNVSSIGGLIGIFGSTAYSSSKFGVIGFSESLRSELKRYGILVSVLCPPAVNTPLWQKANLQRPPEAVALNKNAGVLEPDEVSQELIKGLAKKKFVIIPGRQGKFVFVINRLFPKLREYLADRSVKKVHKQARRKP